MEFPEINNRVRQLVDKYANKSVKKFAESIGIPQQTMNRLFNIDTRTQKYPMTTTDMLVAISRRYPEIDINWLLTGNGTPEKETTSLATVKEEFSLRADRKIEVQDIPLYDMSATAGLVAIFNDNNIHPEDYLRIPNLPLVNGAIYVHGESMVPLLKSGDIIIYKKLELSLDSILWGQIYLLSFIAGGDTFTVVKYIQKSDQPGYIRLVSHNERFQPKDIPLDSICALAIVKASITFHTIE